MRACFLFSILRILSAAWNDRSPHHDFPYGGGRCDYDWECGWLAHHVKVSDRRELPSGNGGQCMTGRCICKNTFGNKYGCPFCSVELHPHYSDSDTGMDMTNVAGDDLPSDTDICYTPQGGGTCFVGECERDPEGNFTLKCAGDITCSPAGSGSFEFGTGVCVGPDGGWGQCLCGKGYYCEDCSLHYQDIVGGARCGHYITGGAFCRDSNDCGGGGFCDYPPDRVPLCKCNPGFTCRRCHHHIESLRAGTGACACDDPIFEPDGGRFIVGKMDVIITAAPWDSEDECEVFWMAVPVFHPHQKPVSPSPEELMVSGTLQKANGLGKLQPAEIEIDFKVFNKALRKLRKNGRTFQDITEPCSGPGAPFYGVYVYAISVKRPNTTWRIDSSSLRRSNLFVLSCALQMQLWGLFILPLLTVAGTI